MGKKIIRRGGKIMTKARIALLERREEISRLHDLQEIEEVIMNELGEEEFLPLTWETDLMTTTDLDTATQLIDIYKYRLEIYGQESEFSHLYEKVGRKCKTKNKKDKRI